VLGALPLLIIGIGLLVGLSIEGTRVAGRLADASIHTHGVVQRIDSQGNPRHATVRWNGHTTRFAFPGNSHPDRGARIAVRYVPGHPDRAYAAGDTTFARADALTGGVLYTAVIVVVVLLVSVVRIARRVSAARQPAVTVKLSRVRTRFGLIQRSWLVGTQGAVERWVPVYWEPDLAGLLADTPCRVHGDLTAGRASVIEIGDTQIWPSGRVRTAQPRGRQLSNPGTYGRGSAVSEQPSIPLSRHGRRDAVFVAIAPLLGLLWAYVNGSGLIGFALSTVLLAGLLFWAPSVYGSDPT
jgi:hypothetical protein